MQFKFHTPAGSGAVAEFKTHGQFEKLTYLQPPEVTEFILVRPDLNKTISQSSTGEWGVDNYDLGTSFSAVLTTINNVGPGISKVGPTCNFGFLSPFTKIVLCVDMLVGRLEIFPFLMIASPSLWRKKF